MNKRDMTYLCVLYALAGWVWGVALSLAVFGEPYAYDPPPNVGPAFAPYQAVGHIRNGNVQGSGTLIATRGNTALVLSCRHVNEVEGARVTVTWPLAGGQVTEGTVHKVVQGGDWGTDIALIICRRPAGVKPVRVAKFRPDEGDWIGVGYRSGQLRVAVSDNAVQTGNTIELNSAGMAFVGGQSGGALFNRNGELVGVIVASDRRSHSICADGPLLHQVINQYRQR